METTARSPSTHWRQGEIPVEGACFLDTSAEHSRESMLTRVNEIVKAVARLRKGRNGNARDKEKRPRGRPVENEMPEPIPDTPENVARACMQGPPKEDWEYLKKDKRGRR